MTLQDFISTVAPETVERLRSVSTKTTDFTSADADLIRDYIDQAAEALGDDQIAEPFRYLVASAAGLRAKDLTALIGADDFDAAAFATFNTALGFPLLGEQQLPNGEKAYALPAQLRSHLQAKMNPADMKSCASDIGYYLLQRCPVDDVVRQMQTLILLYMADEPAGAAAYIGQAQGAALRSAVLTTGNLLKTAPEAIKETIWAMLQSQGEGIRHDLLLTLMVNDMVGILGDPNLVLSYMTRLHQTIEQMLPSHPEASPFLGLAKLRMAQAYRFLRNEQEAQRWYGQGIHHTVGLIKGTPTEGLTEERVAVFWNALKICQEMAQPKGMELLYNELTSLERGASLDRLVLMQTIDMGRSWLSMPKELQGQMSDFCELAIRQLGEHLQTVKTTRTEPDAQVANLFQILGELCNAKGREGEGYEALTEAQIQQMHLLGDLQRRDGASQMSPDQLIARLSLSVTNHMLAEHYRKQNRGQHDLGIVLQNNMDMALECHRFYPRDGRVIHFLINAALELGDMYHKTHGFLVECQTYEQVLQALQPQLNNLQMDQQIAVDVAMLYTKAGQVQASDGIKRYSAALRNLTLAQQLWTSLAKNTKSPDFQKNAEAVSQLMGKLRR